MYLSIFKGEMGLFIFKKNWYLTIKTSTTNCTRWPLSDRISIH